MTTQPTAKELQRTAVQEARVIGAVRRTGARPSTLTGSVQAHTIRHPETGEELVRVLRVEAFDITPEQWQKISSDLSLTTP